MTQKNRVEVKIAGKGYTLVGTEPDEYIQKIGLYIDKKMNEVIKVNSKLSTSMVAVLTALNVADDYFKCHESDGHCKREIKRLQEENEKMKQESKRLMEENSMLTMRNTSLQVEIGKREAELSEVRNSIEKASQK